MKSRFLALGSSPVIFLTHVSRALADGHGHGHDHGGQDESETIQGIKDELDKGPRTYFALSDNSGLIYSHIALMTIAWIVILPVAVFLSLASSRYTLAAQLVFMAFNGFGLLLALFYNTRTPDLYPNNAHHKIGWIITAVMVAHVIVGFLARRKSATSISGTHGRAEEQSFVPLATITTEYNYNDASDDDNSSNDGHCRGSINSIDGGSGTTHAEDYDEDTFKDSRASQPSHRQGLLSAVINSTTRVISQVTSLSTWARYGYKVTDRIILPFGFIAFTSGIATFGRFFEGDAVFNGLAHWIKGGVFFWLGLFNLGRWAGSFADLGWAWNMRPRSRKHQPSAEFVESFLIFIYGSTNIFLEHLGNSDGKWGARDLEHLAITVLFLGGGLCGMLVESTRIRDLLNTTLHSHEAFSGEVRKPIRTPPTYGFSLNPIPALVIALLGTMMSSHHQTTMTSTMVHKQWGQLLLGASVARCLTYIIMYIRPPTSILPSRPPTELLTSFGLIAGGIVFMASSSDTVRGMIHYDLDAMFLYTVTMGLVGILMAWEVAVLAIKGMAIRKEDSHMFRC
ncbi:hypothetical protein B0J15DRAFT_402440 [Fusarium solani]|uniref:Integral membrane protein n=1 Tax=Fusarium solani TaxID=169388 RepID=A0A9P9GXX3_FUSSL|nr:uncharacterized protein B0J15DRAFT_402440 [Fusarium solani]KAH7246902.1 hypothetical protein B0J15DRAFT_402440 [Fusarium solani]